MDVQDCVLLTGAGFTKNFGAPLAADIWSLLFNHSDVQRRPKLRALLTSEFDFETVYSEVMTGQFDPEDRAAITKSIQNAYDHIDSIVREYRGPNIYGVQKFLNAFAGDQRRRRSGFIFTLNQDLFMERQFFNGTRPVLPYIPGKREWFTPTFAGVISPFEVQVTVPDVIAPSMSDIGGDPFYYVKLHGSSNWFHSGGKRQMVIGRGKGGMIAADLLLSFYADLFRAVLVGGAKRVLCIGYGFRDAHINEVLADAVDSGMEMYILSPGSSSDIVSRVTDSPQGQRLTQGLAGIFQLDLTTLFPPDQRTTQEWRSLSSQFFGHFIM